MFTEEKIKAEKTARVTLRRMAVRDMKLLTGNIPYGTIVL